MNARAQSAGYSLVELMVVLLILSALGLGISSYMRRNYQSLKGNDSSEALRTAQLSARDLLLKDLKQTAYVHPSCLDTTGVTTVCSNLKIRSGITPLPGFTKDDVDVLANFDLPNTLETAAADLPSTNDALRIFVYDFTGVFNCRLDRAHPSSNPSATSGSGTGAERMWVMNDCDGLLQVGGLYVITDEIASETHSNVFQITSIQDLGSNIQVDAASTGNLYNQIGGLGLSGFTNTARIYPVKIVEWALGADNVLYRREAIPSSLDLLGYGNWAPLQGNIESLQFYPLTATFSGAETIPVEHQRSMSFSGDVNNDGVEDIRGLSPRFVVKSETKDSGSSSIDNPLTSVVEDDDYPRKEMKFYINIDNRTGT